METNDSPKGTALAASCRGHVLSLARRPPLEGELTFDCGFIPTRLTPAHLPDGYRPWDELAAELPALFLGNRTQSVLERMPRLSALEGALPDSALTRAAVILAAFGHAYWRFGPSRFFPRRITQVSSELPPSILEPWREVSRRLGRHRSEQPFQNFYDLFLSNYRLRDGVAVDASRTIENLDVLIPSFGNEAERVFYMSFVEMHYHLTPLVEAVCEIEHGIAVNDSSEVVAALGRIETGLERATSVWNKISARQGSRVFCDPVLWSKTVAILGVPPEGTPQGATSGACAPMLYVLDALLGRDSYSSRYGRFMVDRAQDFVATSVRGFADAVRRVPLRAYVDAKGDSSEGRTLREALDGVVATYCGDNGWLGRHAAKVFNYLCISTITGRNASVSGDERYFSRQTWVEASAELHDSRSERNPRWRHCPVSKGSSAGCPVARHATAEGAHAHARDQGAEILLEARESLRAFASSRAARLPEYTLLEVARHCSDDDLWLAIDGYVYDISPFFTKHSGGQAILQAYAGQDVSEVFWRQLVHRTRAVATLIERYLVGRLSRTDPTQHEPVLLAALGHLIRCRQSSRMQYEHSMEGVLGLKLLSDESAHMLLLEENLPEVFELLLPGSWARVIAGEPARRARESAQALSLELDLGAELRPETVQRIVARCSLLRDADLTLTERLLERTFDAIATGGKRGSLILRRRALVAAMRREMRQYFAALSSDL